MKTKNKIALGIGGLLATGLGATAYENRKELSELGSLMKRGYKMYKDAKPTKEQSAEEKERLSQLRRWIDVENKRFNKVMDEQASIMGGYDGMYGRTRRHRR